MASLPAVLGYGTQAAFGWYLLFRGTWIINRVIGEGWRKVLLNLADVVFLDSAGVGLIACKYVTLCRHNGQLKLCHLQVRSHEVLHSTKLLTVFEAFPSEADALKSFRAGGS